VAYAAWAKLVVANAILCKLCKRKVLKSHTDIYVQQNGMG